MRTYVINTNNANRPEITLSCVLGTFTFKDGDIVTQNYFQHIDDLARIFPAIFKEYVAPPVVPVIEPEPIVVEEVTEVESVEDEEVSSDETPEEEVKRKGRPKKVKES